MLKPELGPMSGASTNLDTAARSVLILGSYAPSLINFRGSMIQAMRSAGWRVAAVAPDIDEVTDHSLRDLGVKPISVPMARTGLNPLADLVLYRRLVNIFRTEKPDVILAYTIKPVIWGLLAARKGGLPRTVAMITGLGYAFTEGVASNVKQRLVSLVATVLYRLALNRADHVLFQNPDDRSLFLRLGLLVDRGQVSIINGSGVDLTHYLAVPLPDRPVFLMVGRLLGAKGVREYAAAALALKVRHPEWQFLLAGWPDPGPDAIDASELEAWIRAGIEYLGHLDDVRPAIARAQIFVLPSYREGTPRSVLEAMAMGRPIITTDAPGCRETVVTGVNGILVPPRDAVALERAMEELVLQPVRTTSMGQASLAMAQARYDVHKVNAAIMAAVGE